MHVITLRILLVTITLFALPVSTSAQQTFSDLPQDHFAYEAVQFLQQNSIISGYQDGTFRPNAKVNRAEAIKLIMAPLVSEEQIAQATAAQTVYQDVPDDVWFKPYVELARASSIIDGPPAKENFNGGNNVLKAEFIKMVQQAFGADPVTSLGEIRLPLSTDVTNPDEWYYPYLRYAIASSMTMIGSDGTLAPGRELTRAETALLLYRYIMYTEGRRTQALLSEAENEILIILALLDQNEITEAEYASARALLAARGAHLSKPDEPIVQGAVKITEAFRALVRGYRAGINKSFDETIRLSGEAWNLSARGKELSSDLSQIADQIQTISKSMADSAREEKMKAGTPQ